MSDFDNSQPSHASNGVAAHLRDSAEMLVLAGDFANALPLLCELSAANPGEAALQRQLAGALHATGAAEEAAAAYRRARQGVLRGHRAERRPRVSNRFQPSPTRRDICR